MCVYFVTNTTTTITTTRRSRQQLNVEKLPAQIMCFREITEEMVQFILEWAHFIVDIQTLPASLFSILFSVYFRLWVFWVSVGCKLVYSVQLVFDLSLRLRNIRCLSLWTAAERAPSATALSTNDFNICMLYGGDYMDWSLLNNYGRICLSKQTSQSAFTFDHLKR